MKLFTRQSDLQGILLRIFAIFCILILSEIYAITAYGQPFWWVRPSELVILEYNSESTGTILVNSNCLWEVVNCPSWLSVSPISGLNNGTVIVKAHSSNSGNILRLAWISFIGYAGEYHVEDGSAIVCQLPLTPTTSVFNPDLIYDTISDVDGKTYKTVLIGTQTWMAENLKTTKYNDGTSIVYPGVDNSAWENNTNGAYAWYNNDETRFKAAYGALYNWYAVNTGKLCPAGWHVPTDNDWKSLEMNIGLTQEQADAEAQRGSPNGGKMKETGTFHWFPSRLTTNTTTNESGFTALPGGQRAYDALFYEIGYLGSWWSSTQFNETFAWYRELTKCFHNIEMEWESENPIFRNIYSKKTGLSVRCLQDPYLNISSTNISLSSGSGTTDTFTISSNTTWTITTDASWLSISPVSGFGNGTITLTATSENTGTSPRTTVVTIAGTGIETKPVTVIQVQSNSKTLGNTEVYSLTSTSPERRAQTVTFMEAGTIYSISIYHNGGTGKMLLGVYSDADGKPGMRLGLTPETVINASIGWQTAYLINPVSVTSEQKVWLSWVFENMPGIRYIEGEPARAQSTGIWSDGMPDPFGSSVFFNYKYSLYCSYTTETVSISKTFYVDKEKFMIYPNPTENEINVSWEKKYNYSLDIKIYNVLGNAVKEIRTDPDLNEILLDLTGNSRGVYLFEVKDNKNNLILNRSRIIKK